MSAALGIERTATFADPIGGLDPIAWDALAGDHFYSSAGWLRFAAADHGTTAGGLRVPINRTGGGSGAAGVPVAASDGEPSGWNRPLDEAGVPRLDRPGLLVGARRGHRTNILATPGIPRPVAAQAVLQEVRRLGEDVEGDGPAVALFLGTEDASLLREAGAESPPVFLGPDAWIPVPEGGWDAWVRSLPSKRRTDIVRGDRRRFGAAGYEIVHTTLGECVTETARLIASTERRRGFDPDRAAIVESIRRQADYLGTRARVVLARRPGHPPAGFCLFYVRGDTLYLRAAGFDYERLAGAAEEVNLAYYIPVRIATAIRARWVHAGLGAGAGKLHCGAILRPLWMLDLSPSSRLRRYGGRVRAYNSARLSALRGSSPEAARALAEDQWRPFC